MPRTQPFEFPDFYLPWPARCSPHVDGARAHTKHWAREVGILDTPPEDATPQIWDEAKFDSMDIGLFCALAHPDALPPDLELIADWIVWAFDFDDLFVEVYKRIGDANGLRAQLVRLALFMPFDQAAQRPEPANPIERALLDLWRRTMPAHSVEWRRRFHTATTDLLDVVRWELRNISADRVANPNRVRAVAPAGRRRAMDGVLRRAREPRRGPRSRMGATPATRAHRTPSPTPCTTATTSSATTARSTRKVSWRTSCWSSSGSSASGCSRPRRW